MLEDPQFGFNRENQKPKAPTLVSRRAFLKDLVMGATGVALGASLLQKGDRPATTALQKSEVEESIKNWEFWQKEMLKQLKKSMDYLENMDIKATATSKVKRPDSMYTNHLDQGIKTWESILKISIKQSRIQYESILKLLPEIQNLKIYKGYLKAFNEWMKMAQGVPSDMPNDLYQQYQNQEYIINSIEQFINNVKYSDRVEKEYEVSVTGENANFFLTDMKSVYEAFSALPRFAIKKSGFEKLTLAEPMPGAIAQMGEHEMTGRFKERYLNASVAYHELTHAFDGHVEKEQDNKGWLKLNKAAEPYVYSSGMEAIKASIENPKEAELDNAYVKGYARGYGQRGGIFEDKATISEALFSEYGLRELINRSMKDPILKRKVEFMVGHKIDNPYILNHNKNKTDKQVLEDYEKDLKATKKWVDTHIKDKARKKAHLNMVENMNPRMHNFGTPLTEQDYIDAGFPGYCYWPVWSRDDKGKIWMDADYFNSILTSRKMTFKEQNGETIREIPEELEGKSIFYD